MCCRSGDKCRRDGLCGDSPHDGLPWRGMCTDQTWNSSKCLKLCINGTSSDPGPLSHFAFLTCVVHLNPDKYPNHQKEGQWEAERTDIPVTHCPDSSICCGDPSITSECCIQKRGRWISDSGEVTDVNPSGNPSTNDTEPTHSAAPKALSPSRSSGASSTITVVSETVAPAQLNHTASIVGGTIGGLGSIVLITITIWFLTRRHRRNSRETSPTQKEPAMTSNTDRQDWRRFEHFELHGAGRPHEIDGVIRTELPGKPLPIYNTVGTYVSC